MSAGNGKPGAADRAEDVERPELPVEGTFVEGLFIPTQDEDGEAAPPTEAERLDDVVNGSMPPGGTYS